MRSSTLHGGFRTRSAGPGRHLWHTPHGDTYLVDGHGTTRLTEPEARLHLTAPPGMDVYTPRFEIAYEPGVGRRRTVSASGSESASVHPGGGRISAQA